MKCAMSLTCSESDQTEVGKDASYFSAAVALPNCHPAELFWVVIGLLQEVPRTVTFLGDPRNKFARLFS